MPLNEFMGKCCNSLPANVLFAPVKEVYSSVKIKLVDII